MRRSIPLPNYESTGDSFISVNILLFALFGSHRIEISSSALSNIGSCFVCKVLPAVLDWPVDLDDVIRKAY